MLAPDDEDGGLEAPPTLIPPEDELEQLGQLVVTLVDREAPTDAVFIPLRSAPARPMWAWPAGLLAALVVSSVPFGILLGVGLRWSAAEGPVDGTQALAQVATPPPEPPAPRGIVPVRPEPVPTVSAPEAPVAPVARSEPVADPREAPAPRPTGTVTVEGDAQEVWLVSGKKKIPARGRIVPGRYVIRASFGDGIARKAGMVVVRSGETIKIRCASFVYACTEVSGR